MKKISISVFALAMFIITTLSGDYFFYYDNNKMTLNRNLEYLTVKFKPNTPITEIDRVYNGISAYAEKRMDFNSNLSNGTINNVLIIKLNSNVNSDAAAVIEAGIRNNTYVEHTGMCFTYNDKVLHFTTDEVIVKFKKEVSRSAIDNLNSLFKTAVIQQIESFDNTFLVSLNPNNSDNVFEAANRYALTQFVEFSQPNFIRTGMLLSEESTTHTAAMPNDTMVPRMWHVKNTGNNIPDNIHGTPGCDMNLERAWEITTGNPNVLIAIIDTGVDTNHTDLRPNLCDRTLWYDAFDNDQKPYDEYYHGTGVTGTSSAAGNNIAGTAGVAYRCKIMPVRVFGPAPTAFTTDLILAKGLNWAWMHGASVMNCSWGGGIPTPLITHAIRNAVDFGRNGKGSVIFGGAGNADTNVVIYPASMPEVIGVGGLSPCNERKSRQSCDNIGGVQNWGACFGEGMEIVAPTTYIGATELGGGWCICGNGTSVSSPLAAGVGALMISKNINISGDSVKMIIEKYAVKVGSYSYNVQKENGMWNEEMGYGKIDAKVCLDYTPAGPIATYDQVPPVIKIYPPESKVYGLPISVDADIYDLSGLAVGQNGPRLYYMFENSGILESVKGVPVSTKKDRFTFFIPTPPNKGLFYYIAAQDNTPIPNMVTYPLGGYGIDPPGFTPPKKMMYVKNTSTAQEIFASTDVPIPIATDRETTFVSLLDVPLNATILDIKCQVNIIHTFDADLTLSLISPAGTEIVLVGGAGWEGDNFENTLFSDEAAFAIDSSAAMPPYSGIYRPIEKLWLLDGENSQGQWKLKVTDNGFADGGSLLGWNITITYSNSSSDNVSVPQHFSLIGNYPNPFNPATRILFNVPRTSNIKITVFDVSGREVKTVLNETRNAGFNEYVDFDASGFASGVYFYTMTANDELIDSKKMILIK